VSLGWQTDVAYKLDAEHTVRAGLYLQHDRAASDTDSLVLPTDSSGSQTTDVPIAITDNGSKTQSIESVYLQDEWRVIQPLVLNYGLRFDHYTAYSSGSQLSPRINAVWNPTAPTTVHAGYSRYFTPPPFELVGGETISKFVNTTAAPEVTVDDAPKAERSDYFDVGVEQKMGKGVTVGIDAYFRRSEHLIDEGQFGAPIILTPFNYKDGKVEGAELTANYAGEAFSSYANLAFQSAKGRGIETSQFNFSQDDLDYIAGHYIDLDHEQIVTASAGASYLWDQTRFSADMLLGTGLRADLTLPDGSSIPNGAHLPMYTQVNLGVSQNLHIDSVGALTLRADVINVFDKVYEIRNGTGVGVGAPQFGPRRGVFVGITKYL
jgi:outer membrane receptor protein involved in Fe transport